jgi:hypothetical protein
VKRMRRANCMAAPFPLDIIDVDFGGPGEGCLKVTVVATTWLPLTFEHFDGSIIIIIKNSVSNHTITVNTTLLLIYEHVLFMFPTCFGPRSHHQVIYKY